VLSIFLGFLYTFQRSKWLKIALFKGQNRSDFQFLRSKWLKWLKFTLFRLKIAQKQLKMAQIYTFSMQNDLKNPKNDLKIIHLPVIGPLSRAYPQIPPINRHLVSAALDRRQNNRHFGQIILRDL
jgi:hypothetical protein